jgi:hypothetical protein
MWRDVLLGRLSIVFVGLGLVGTDDMIWLRYDVVEAVAVLMAVHE